MPELFENDDFNTFETNAKGIVAFLHRQPNGQRIADESETTYNTAPTTKSNEEVCSS